MSFFTSFVKLLNVFYSSFVPIRDEPSTLAYALNFYGKSARQQLADPSVGMETGIFIKINELCLLVGTASVIDNSTVDNDGGKWKFNTKTVIVWVFSFPSISLQKRDPPADRVSRIPLHGKNRSRNEARGEW